MNEIIYWDWEEAFDKFGFEDGDGWNGTHLICDFIESLGYKVDAEKWGLHNYMIESIKSTKDGELMDWDKNQIGYDNPRSYLPKELVDKLDAEFPSDNESSEKTNAVMEKLDESIADLSAIMKGE